jgi:hypothetical protein
MANPGTAAWLEGNFQKIQTMDRNSLRLHLKNGPTMVFTLLEEGNTLELRYEGKTDGSVRVLDDALAITDIEGGYAIVPSREGLLIPANGGKEFKRVFGTSDYEGCHMNMLGFVKAGSALILTWDNAYVFPELQSTRPSGKRYSQRLTTTLELRRSANSLRLMPLGKGDFNTVAAGYRHYAEKQGLAATLREKINRDPHVELMIGASNAKLWTCLARRMNEESTKEESVRIRWTFNEAAQIAQHLILSAEVTRVWRTPSNIFKTWATWHAFMITSRTCIAMRKAGTRHSSKNAQTAHSSKEADGSVDERIWSVHPSN